MPTRRRCRRTPSGVLKACGTVNTKGVSPTPNSGNPFTSTNLICHGGNLISYGNHAITYANPPASYIAAGTRALRAATCSSCHGNTANGTTIVNGKTEATIGPNLQGVGAATVDFWVSSGRMPATDVKAVEAERRPTRLTPQQALEIAAWVNSLDPAVPAVPYPHLHRANQSVGAELFSLNCAACHTIEGTGDALAYGTNAPSLMNRAVTPQQVVEAIRTGACQHAPLLGQPERHTSAGHRVLCNRQASASDQPRWLLSRWGGTGGRRLRRSVDRRGRPRPHLLLDRRAVVSDADHQPSRTRVPMPIAALSDPHMSDAARHPRRVENIIAVVFVVAMVFFGIAGAAYWQNWSPWIFGGALGAGMFALGLRSHCVGQVPDAPGTRSWKNVTPWRSHLKSATPCPRPLWSAPAVVVKRRKMLGGLFAVGGGIFGIVRRSRCCGRSARCPRTSTR